MMGLTGFMLFTMRTDGSLSGLLGFCTKKALHVVSVDQVTYISAPDFKIQASSLLAAFSK